MSDQENYYLEVTQAAIAKFREKLLDLSNRNNLLNLSFNARSNRNIRIIDELPNNVFNQLHNNEEFELIPLPDPKNEYEDELTEDFLSALEFEKLNNSEYLKEVEDLGEEYDESNLVSLNILRKLKDHLREKLGMEKRIAPDTVTIEEYAKSMGLNPNYEVPFEDNDNTTSEIHTDNNLQTLFYRKDLERKCRLLNKEYQKQIDEKGTNTLYISFGCLEWYENEKTRRVSPLLLYPVKFSSKKTSSGIVYKITSSESELDLNLTLSKRLERDFGILLPYFTDEIQSPESYFDLIEKELIRKKPEWKLKRYINITIHTYSKLSMYEDLDPDKWMENGHILGEQKNLIDLFTGTDKADIEPSNYDLDNKEIISKVPVLIDNADSSQFSTIIDAVNGNNLVIQGPPGTGKSTTIANIIASLLFKNKKVLFMAEKKAALDVVHKKLSDKNLDPFSFRLSATTEKKSDFIAELKQRVETFSQGIDEKKINDLEEKYYKLINQIKEYRSFLNKKFFKIDYSGHDLLINFAKSKFYSNNLHNTFEELIPFKDILQIRQNEYFDNLNSIDKVVSNYRIIKEKYLSIDNHPWYGIKISENNTFNIEELKKIINDLKDNTNKQIKLVNEFNAISTTKLSLEDFTDNIFNTIKLSEKVDLKNKYLLNINAQYYFDKIREFQELILSYTEYIKSKNKIESDFDLKENISIDLLERYKRFIINSNFFSFLFDKNYKEAKNFYKRIKLDGKFKKQTAINDIDIICRYLKELPNIEKNIKLIDNYNELKNIFEGEFKGKDTDINIINDLCTIINLQEINDDALFYIIVNSNQFDKLKNLSEYYFSLKNIFLNCISKLEMYANIDLFLVDTNNLLEINNKIATINIDNDEDLNILIKFNYDQLNLKGLLKIIIDDFVSNSADFNNIKHAYNFIVFKSLAHQLFDKEKSLSKFNVLNFEDEIDDFKELDEKIFEEKKELLIDKLAEVEPEEGIRKGKAGDLTEYSLIKREIDKQRAHIPYRQLLSRAGNALIDLMPCFMLSPISLSQISDAKPDIYDVLIIDEASQMKIEDALGGILRSKQIIIVGDPEQLPPSNFFSAKTNFDGEDIVDDDESILDLALSKYKPKRMLKWHYRSNHESLINFSNHYFYNSSLIIPPSASDKFAINHHKINGTYNARSSRTQGDTNNGLMTPTGGTNAEECKAISKGVTDFMRLNPDKSCLVVTMNNVQRDLIDEQIRLIAYNDTDIEEYKDYWKGTMEPFVVKNLENVQGDERDYIFISTLFGPDNNGQVMQRFGPINNPKGHRRLNVLFTRAKDGIELYTSLNSDDVKDSKNSERGRRILKKYLEYARNQVLDSGTVSNRESGSDFQDWVAEELELSGFEVVQEVGVSGFFIDLGVKHKDWPHGYLAGIECDGATYHSSLSARDNDIVRQNVLENYGWNIYRVWSTNWFRDPRQEMDKLTSYLNGKMNKI